MTGFTSLLSFQGRLGRGGYWVSAVYQIGGVLLLAVVSGLVMGLNQPMGEGPRLVAAGVWGLGGLLLAWMGLAATVRRWHDRDKSGWWALVGAVPFIGPIWVLFELGFLSGTPGGNRFGPPPIGGGLRDWAETAPADDGDLEGIVARWTASTSTPVAVAVGSSRLDARRDARPSVITRPGQAGGFGRRGLR